MSDKVKLPKEVAEAIVSLRNQDNGFSNYAIIGMLYEPHRYELADITTLDSHMGQDKMHPDDLLAALVNGYEVEEEPQIITVTPEQKERLRQYYSRLQTKAESEAKTAYSNTIRTPDTHEMVGILTTLNFLNIKITGINT